MKKISLLLCVCLFGFNLCSVFASHGHDEEDKTWSPSSAGPVTTWTAPLCGKGKFVIQPFVFYNNTRGLFNKEGNYSSLAEGDKKYQYQEQIFMQYGLTNAWEVDFQTVYQQNYIKQGNLKAHSKGFGDSYMFLRYCPLEETKWLPHIDGLLQFKFPTGKYQKADPNKLGTDLMGASSGGGSYDQGLGFILTKKIKPFILHGDVIYNFPQKVKINGIKTKYANYLNYDFGVEYFLPKGFNLMLEFNGLMQGDRREDDAHIPSTNVVYLNVAPGFGWSNDKVQTLIAYQRTLVGTNTDKNDSAIVTFVYTF